MNSYNFINQMGCTTYGNKQTYSCHWVLLLNKRATFPLFIASSAIILYIRYNIACSMLWEHHCTITELHSAERTEGVQH